MKKTLIIIAILSGLANISISAQTTEPTPESVPIKTPYNAAYPALSSYSIQNNPDDFKIEVPFLGWMWFSKPVISAMFYANQAHIFGSDEFEHYDWLNSHYCKSFINAPNLTIMSNLYYDGVDTIGKPIPHYNLLSTYHGDGTGLLLARALHFDPSITISSEIKNNESYANYYTLAEQCDSTNNSSVFGFTQKNISVVDINTSGNYVQLIKSKYPMGPTLVLSEPWKLDVLTVGSGEYVLGDSAKDIGGHIQKFNGNKYYLSINCQRINEDINYVYGEMANVLKVEMTYKDAGGLTDNIYWNLVPSDSDVISPSPKRGEYGALNSVPDGTTYFYIKRKSIPVDGTPITLSGYCTFFNRVDYNKSNPRTNDTFKMNINNIKISYYNSCDVQINNICLDSPNGRLLFQGGYDEIIKNEVGNSISKFTKSDDAKANQSNTRFAREVTLIETGPQTWAADRYFRKLIGDINLCLSGPELSALYEAYVNPRDRWIEMVKFYERVAVPYKRKFTDELYKQYSMGIICGFDEKKVDDTSLPKPHKISKLDDTLNSGYETYFRFNQTRAGFNTCTHDSDKCNYIDYDDRANFAYSVQYYWDYIMKRLYYQKNITGFQYSGKQWYSMIFIDSEYLSSNMAGPYGGYADGHFASALDSKRLYIGLEDPQKPIPTPEDKIRSNYNYFHYYRPLTAEEVRLMDYSQIIMGGKGFAYDGALQTEHTAPYDSSCHDSTFRTQLAYDNPAFNTANEAYLTNPATFDREAAILNPNIGGDFLDEVVAGFNTPLKRNFYQWDFTGQPSEEDRIQKANQYIGGSKDRIYVGMMSTRWEIYKIHRWLVENGDILGKLKLQAWYGHGFLKLYNQHPTITSDTLLKQFVKINNITTRRPWIPVPYDPQTPGAIGDYRESLFDETEPLNDQFFDITLLKEDNIPLNVRYYIGLQSRRTDPLIWRKILNSPETWNLCFYTGAELDKLCDVGGYDPFDKNVSRTNYTAEDWQDLYRKRLGCREISIDFEKMFSSEGKLATVFLIENLPYQLPWEGTPEYDDLKYWQKDAYKHNVSNFYTMSILPFSHDSVNIKFLPGEGRIFRITPYYNIIWNIIERKDTTNTNPIDTCEALRNGLRVGFFKVNTGDANVCKYRVYLWNYSDSCNFNVPIQVNIQSDDSLVITNSDSLNFRFINMKTCYGYQNCWIPNGIVQTDTTYIGYISGFCDTSRVSYTVGMRDCYTTDTLTLRCSTCDCCENVNVNLAPINTENFCFLRPFMSQTTVLPNSETCFYYGLKVSGGFAPSDNILIPDLSIVYDSLNPQPINFPAYAETLANQFLNIYCYPICVYCLKLTYQNINGDDVCSKEVCITIDNSQAPPEITPQGAISSDCYSIMPSGKRNVPSEEVHAGQKMIVDPNPTTGKANVKLNLENDLVGRLVLYTSTGELIKEIYNGKLPSGSSDYQIDLSSQPSGMYIITIESDGMQYIKKFVKE